MKLAEFAKRLPEGFTEQEFVDMMNEVIDLKTIVDLPKKERDALFDGVQYLVDFVMLAQEVNDVGRTYLGSDVLDYNGPFIPTRLTRPSGKKVDRTALDNFGVGEADKYFGTDRVH